MEGVIHDVYFGKLGSMERLLADRLHHAENEGMNQEAIGDLAFQIGDYLSNQVQPKNEQEKILSDLWSVADEKEQHAIANMMVKLVHNNGTK